MLDLCLKDLHRYSITEKEYDNLKKLKITNNIRTLRFFANEITQQQLAEKVGASRQTIVAVEAGKYTPSLELAFRIADAFNVKIDEVFEYETEEK